MINLATIAQDQPQKVDIGIGLTGAYSTPNGLYVSPNVEFIFAKHNFFVGFKFTMNKIWWGYLTSNPINFGEKVGVIAGYRYFPNLTQKRISLFFQYDVQYVSYRGKLRGATRVLNISGSIGHVEYIHMTDVQNRLFENIIGYGFRLRVVSNLYISHSFGYGAAIICHKGNTSYTETYKWCVREDSLMNKITVIYVLARHT